MCHWRPGPRSSEAQSRCLKIHSQKFVDVCLPLTCGCRTQAAERRGRFQGDSPMVQLVAHVICKECGCWEIGVGRGSSGPQPALSQASRVAQNVRRTRIRIVYLPVEFKLWCCTAGMPCPDHGVTCPLPVHARLRNGKRSMYTPCTEQNGHLDV